MTRKTTLLICLAILLAAVAFTVLVFLTEPTATRTGATRETAMLVEVTDAERGSYRPTIVALGAVEPAHDIILTPQVSGEVVRLGPAFTPGGFVAKGELLLQIETADYRNRLQQARSDLHQAEADLAVEMGRQTVALKDYQLLEKSLSPEDKTLLLREPQLNAARARVEAADAAVAQAELNLHRTTITAPFDAHVLRRGANPGSRVAPGEDLGRLVGLDTYWVIATVPVAQLRWLTVPANPGERGSPVRVRDPGAWPGNTWREGYVTGLVGALEPQTRMARVVVAVPDPLARDDGNRERPRLIIGAYVEAHIEARELDGVIRLDRDHLRADDTVWIMDGDSLRIRAVDIVFRDARYAYLHDGLNTGERIVTTNLSTVVDGAPLRLAGNETAQRSDSLALRESAPDPLPETGGRP